ncbi:precorrin-6y C5,15-methyltransferase (decarboxylating) subunit CbiE [Pseudaestuariivita sp.]|uniref:precorrin-6y C5,15-methyltransferase (decarboxylating) subunit CbiE n=1 Tax=Pseudaestuariivita sp. TaxID=2211669 RepID=UPI004059FA38
MSDPWLTIIGLGEDGLNGLSSASRKALDAAQHVFGAARHLALAEVDGTPWPIPFDTAPLLACRGQKTVALVSGDPFWYGAGGSLMRDLAPGEWTAHPAPSTFQWITARLGWRMEDTLTHGLHAAPFETLLPLLTPGARVICTLRDGQAAGTFAAWLTETGFGTSALQVCERMGGPQERIRQLTAAAFDLEDVDAPVAVAIEVKGPLLQTLPGRSEGAFQHDGQISKRHVRALTLMSLNPFPGAHLWDLGAGSGGVSVEWCLAAKGATATAVEQKPVRCANIRSNAAQHGLSTRLSLLEGQVPDVLPDTPADAVFFGGGATQRSVDLVWSKMPTGAQLVINAVTLETEALVADLHAKLGGTLTKIEISEATPLGTFRGWTAARPVVQWSVTR